MAAMAAAGGGADPEMAEQHRLMKELEESFVDPLLRLDYDSDEEDLIPSIDDVLGHVGLGGSASDS